MGVTFAGAIQYVVPQYHSYEPGERAAVRVRGITSIARGWFDVFNPIGAKTDWATHWDTYEWDPVSGTPGRQVGKITNLYLLAPWQTDGEVVDEGLLEVGPLRGTRQFVVVLWASNGPAINSPVLDQKVVELIVKSPTAPPPENPPGQPPPEPPPDEPPSGESVPDWLIPVAAGLLGLALFLPRGKGKK